MIWITKYRHNKIVAGYEKYVEDLREALNRKEGFEKILDKLTDKMVDFGDTSIKWVSGSDIMINLDDTVPRYVDDYFGGKIIKQESTPVTILDRNGKATYGVTARKPKKGKNFILHYDDKL
jgi:hypothetical protein